MEERVTVVILKHRPYNSILWELYLTYVALHMLKPRIVKPNLVNLMECEWTVQSDYLYKNKFIIWSQKIFVILEFSGHFYQVPTDWVLRLYY